MTNVDIAEINKFGDIAHQWWDTQSMFKPLHQINPVRLQFIDQIASIKNKKVLDVGCGGGILSESMALLGAKVTGIDLGEQALNVAKLHALETSVKMDNLKLDYECIAVEALAEAKPASFDVVTCMEMLEHVPNPASVVSACARLVKPGGHVFFSTINRNLKAYAMAVLGAEYILQLLPKGTHDYEKFIKPSELANWMRQSDLTLIEQKGLSYAPLSQRFSLVDDVSVNYMVHAIKA